MNAICWDAVADPERDSAAELDAILLGRLLSAHFQPILRSHDLTLLGWEALIRGPAGSPLGRPDALFSAARQEKRLSELDYVCRETAIIAFSQQGGRAASGKLFLNVEPTALIEGARKGWTHHLLALCELPANRVVIELTEASPHTSFALLRTAVDHYRSQGFEIAIDDLGEGYASLRLWAEIRPDYVKIDRHFIQRAPSDPAVRRLLELIVGLSEQIGSTTIAEGVERPEEWQLVRHLGIDAVQGFLLAKPAPTLVAALPSDQAETLLSQSKRQTPPAAPNAATLASLLPPVTPATLNETVYQRFLNNPALTAIPVVDDENRPLGIILRQHFLEDFSRPYRHELFGRKSCLHYRQAARTVTADTTIHDLSRLLQSAPLAELGRPFLVVDADGHYLGVGDGQSLLRTLVELQLEAARYANPLSGLPGNVVINQTIDQYLQDERPFVATYLDISYFKAYNDVYGFSRGDEMIRLVSDLLRRTVRHPEDFIGHIGGDDFLILWVDPEWEARVAELFAAFTSALPAFYKAEDWQAGGIHTEDRQGNLVFHPLSALTIGAVPVPPRAYPSYHAVAAVASEAKKLAKKEGVRLAAQGIVPANALFVERRSCHQGVTIAR